MKKKRKKQVISVLLMIATIFSLMPGVGNIPEAQASDAETVVNTTATAYNPIDKVIFTKRTDGRYDVSIHFDKNVYTNASYAAIDNWVVKDIVSDPEKGQTARTLTGWDSTTVQKNNYTMKISTVIWENNSVAPGETIKLGSGARTGNDISSQMKYVYGTAEDSRLIEAAKSFTAPSAAVKPEPAPEQTKDLFDKVTGYTYDLTGNYKSVYMNVKAKSGPASGEKLWIYNKSDGMLYGDSATDTISAIISRKNKENQNGKEFDLGETNCKWVVVSAPDPDSAKKEGLKVSANGNGTMKMMSSATIINERVPGTSGKISYSSSRYDRVGVNINATSFYIPPDMIEVYSYNKNTGAETKYKTFKFSEDDKKQEGSFTVTGLTPGTVRYYTVYVSAIIGGQIFTRHDGQYHAVKSADFKKASVLPVKMTAKKAKIVVNVPGTQAARDLSTMYVYKGNKKIKTLKSNGKTSLSFTYTGSKASASGYKVKSVCAKKTSINNVSVSKKPCSNTYKRPGYITGNINNITRYGTAAFEPWQVTYYDGKITVTGYIANNRIFKLKSIKFKADISNNGKKIASKTMTYKNIKPYAIKKVSFSIKTKKCPDFKNLSTDWGIRGVKAKW